MRKTLQGLEQLLSDYQHARILRLIFPHKDAVLFASLVNQLDASQGRSRDLALNRWLWADNARPEPENLTCLPCNMTRDGRE
ncbi:hypothetical protein EJD96_19315 [Herbaspirillum seropedicae]|uniref:hypothetical protein n=1 Tax=Herbaspirillum seropedicae TaxID=964 RepID=UPI00111F4028|nr:hypothetical protein [Herbaspirillum seropedicae]QDD66160.1 hypothetical protein EJD96_19315 [Herbaspirillum seropedicae]